MLAAASQRATAAPEDAVGPAAPEAATSPRPLLWVVDGDPKIYLFGTIHLPDPRVVALPDVVKGAFAAADAVYVEVRSEELEAPEIQMRAMIPDGKTLGDVVPKETLERTRKYLAGRGLTSAGFEKFRPWALAATLPILDYLALLATTPPLDKTLYLDAKKAGKVAEGLETADEQLKLFEGLGAEKEAKFLDNALAELEKAAVSKTDPTKELVDLYVAGDDVKLRAFNQKQMDEGGADAKEFSAALLDKRNETMVAR